MHSVQGSQTLLVDACLDTCLIYVFLFRKHTFFVFLFSIGLVYFLMMFIDTVRAAVVVEAEALVLLMRMLRPSAARVVAPHAEDLLQSRRKPAWRRLDVSQSPLRRRRRRHFPHNLASMTRGVAEAVLPFGRLERMHENLLWQTPRPVVVMLLQKSLLSLLLLLVLLLLWRMASWRPRPILKCTLSQRPVPQMVEVSEARDRRETSTVQLSKKLPKKKKRFNLGCFEVLSGRRVTILWSCRWDLG